MLLSSSASGLESGVRIGSQESVDMGSWSVCK